MNEILPIIIGIGALGVNVAILSGILFSPGGLLLYDHALVLIGELIYFMSLTGYLFYRLLKILYPCDNEAFQKDVQRRKQKSNE